MMCVKIFVQCFTFIFVLGRTSCQLSNSITADGCTADSDCASGMICVDFQCTDLCKEACGLNAVCASQGSETVCFCEPGYKGDPFTECIPAESENVECARDSQCSEEKACINYRCLDPCEGACGVNSQCRVVNHRALCACLEGFTFIPTAGCTPLSIPSCRLDSHCPEDQACRQQRCVNPCDEGVCEYNMTCAVHKHQPVCYNQNGCLESTRHNRMAYNSSVNNVKLSNKTYYISDFKIDWFSASYYCQNQGMRLAEVHNQLEWLDLFLAYRAKKYPAVEFWIGGKDNAYNQTFTWYSTGYPLSFHDWRIGEPEQGLYCLKISYNFDWVSQDCSHEIYFACENF